MKLRSKILLGYGLILSLIFLVGGWGLFNIRRLGLASDAILKENYRSILAADNMINALERQDSAVLLTLLSDANTGSTQFRNNEAVFWQWFGRAEDNVTLPGEQQNLDRIEQSYRDFLTVVEQVEPSANNTNQDISTSYNSLIFPAFQRIHALCRELRIKNQQAMATASQAAQAVSLQAMASLAIAGVAAAFLGLMLSWILSDRLIHPLKKIMAAMGQVAEGDYDVDLSIQTGDELELVAQAFGNMTQKLKTFHKLNVGQIIAEKRRGDAVLNSISDGVVVVDDHLQIVNINPTAARIFDVPIATALNHSMATVVNDSGIRDSMEKVVELGQLPQQQDSPLTLTQEGDSSSQYFNVIITPVTTESNRKLGGVLLLQDVTHFKQLDQIKSEFVATASHELRTPLTGMMMSINLLLEQTQGKLTEGEQDLLNATEENIQRLHSLVNDLLDLSKMESGHVVMERSPTALSPLCEEVTTIFAVEATQKHITIQTRIPTDLPQVDIDASKITWVLTNLIANALRYSNAGGEIRIQAQVRDSHVQVDVADDGDGIPLEYQERLFDKFVQVETQKDVGGSGLGLAICQEIVSAHNGNIWVNSTPGKGSTFSFTLPLVRSH